MLYNQQCDQSHNQIRTSQNLFDEVNKIELKYMSVIFTSVREYWTNHAPTENFPDKTLLHDIN